MKIRKLGIASILVLLMSLAVADSYACGIKKGRLTKKTESVSATVSETGASLPAAAPAA